MKIAICVVSSDNSYVYQSILTLLSVKKNNPNENFFYFIAGNLSNRRKKFIKKNGIDVIDLDANANLFQKRALVKFPVEVFYTAFVPKKTYEMGFDYVVILDGDVLCLNKIPSDIISSIKELGFSSEYFKIFEQSFLYYKVMDKIAKEFDLDKNHLNKLKYGINSGIGIYNCKACVKKDLEGKFTDFYKRVEKIAYFFSDEEIINLLILKNYFKWQKLDNAYNFRNFNANLMGLDLDSNFDLAKGKYLDKNVYFLHLQIKPWNWYLLKREFKHVMKKYTKYYSLFAKSIYGYKYFFYIYFYSFIRDYQFLSIEGLTILLKKMGLKNFLNKWLFKL